jgi:hypothetical protein
MGWGDGTLLAHLYRVIAERTRRGRALGREPLLNVDSHDLLHIRSFLDHNRPWARLSNYAPGSCPVRTTGAFAYLGEEIAGDEQEENLEYLVEAPVFMACAAEAGLQADPRVAARFPASGLATITLNFFTAFQE